MNKEEFAKYVEKINERIHEKLKDDEEIQDFYSRLVVGFNAICEENKKQKEVIDKAIEYATKEKNNYLHHVQKVIGECIDNKGNINSNKAGLIISAVVNTCDCVLDILNEVPE